MNKFIKFQTINDDNCCVAVNHIVSIAQSPDYPAHYFVVMVNGDRFEIEEKTAKKVISGLTGDVTQ